MTGNPVYQDRAYAVLRSLKRYTKTWGGGYVRLSALPRRSLHVEIAQFSLDDVLSTRSRIIDNTPSFFFAELLKCVRCLVLAYSSSSSLLRYLYLTFSDPDLISIDHYVFNTGAPSPYRIEGFAKAKRTEAHPFILH